MAPGSRSTLAIWLCSIAIGLLFLARGAFQPYAFPLFENLAGLSYARIALLLNGYVMAQSLGAPIAGWYTDRTSVRIALTTSIVFGLSGFFLIAASPGFALSLVAVLAAGLGFVLGKIALNTLLVSHSSADNLRRSVAKRATLLNLGSFFGNSVAYQMTTRVGYGAHAVLLGLLQLPLALGLFAPSAPTPTVTHSVWGGAGLKALLRNRSFLADGLRRFAIVLPYGCWGTIIPKYVIDQYHSNEQVWLIYLTSLCTTLVGAHFLAVYLSARLYRLGFKWQWWSLCSLALYCVGLLLLVFAQKPGLLVLAVAVFICGEVLMTPCFDETAKRHSGDAGLATCLGLLHLVDGAGRMLGAAFALAIYGSMRASAFRDWYWPMVVAVFLGVSLALHVVAHALERGGDAAGLGSVGRRLVALVLPTLGLLGLAAAGCAGRPTTATRPDSLAHRDANHLVHASKGMVVSVSGPAADVGRAILQRGGNAVDAAIATAFALAVAYPPAGNLGGGGFMLVHPAAGDGAPVVFDYREVAPAAAQPTMFAPDDTQYTQKASATPGTVRGLALAHRRFGSLPWAELLRPAVQLARDGFVLDRRLVGSVNITLAAANDFAEFQRVFAKPGEGFWKTGDRMVQPDLARTLQLLADLGPDAFYTGPIAAAIVAEMTRGNGIMTAADLAGYRAIERKPLTTRYRGVYDVYVPPPPSSGGTCLLEELHMLEAFDLKAWGRWAPTTLHAMVEAMRRANYDRARYLGDPAHVAIPAELTTRAYGRQLGTTIDLHKATRSRDLAADIPLAQEGESTTHFSIIDARGMAVANTYTLERRWGSRIVVKDMGFLLNNDMFAFNTVPGVTDTKGGIGTAPNTIAPGKRPLSSQTPTIVARDGHVTLITGSPGSRAIPHTILEILVSVLDFGLPPESAVAAPRFSHQWLPDEVTFETPERYPNLVEGLRALGHVVVRHGPVPQGDAHTIWVAGPGRYVGVADARINGKASGY